VMTSAFLEFSKSCGNDLSTPLPEFGFPGLKPGDRWCLCAPRWQEAFEANQAPRVVLRATHESALVYCSLADLKRFAVDLDLRWEQVDLENAILHVRRVKQGNPATHPLTGRELHALRRLQREQESKSPFVFVSERGTPFSNRGFQAMVERVARAAGFDMKIHPHMLRHSCGYKLANDGVDTRTIRAYLGHKSIQRTVRYTELAPTRFRSLFRD
jgi:site-specific recombinase XerC